MIVPMERVRIYGPRELLDDTICMLYELGTLQPEPLSSALTSRVSVPDRRMDDREAARERVELEALYEKVRRSLVLLPTPPARGGTPTRSFSAASLHEEATRRTVDDLFKRIESLSGKRKAAADRIALLAKYQKMVSAILPLVERVGDLTHLEMVGLTVAREQRAVIALIDEELKKATGGLVQVFSTDVDDHTVAALVLYGPSDAKRVRSLLWDRNLSELKLPSEIEQLPLQHALAEIGAQSESLPKELQVLDEDLAGLAAGWHPYLSALGEELSDRLQQLNTRSSFFRTRYTFVIAGWIPRADLPRLQRRVEKIAAGRIVVEGIPVSREEEGQIPVHLRNPPLIRPFEVFLRLLPLPVYRSLDPTPLLAFFFPLFFGLIVGDIGYGLAIAAIALLLRRRFPARSQLHDLLTVVLYSSGVAVLFGVAFGELFGTLGEAFGLHPLHPNLNRLKAIPFFLGLSIGIGCLHVFLGLGLGVVNAVRTRHRAAIKHRVGQAASLAGLILVLAALSGGVGRWLLAPSAALLVGGCALWIAGEGFAAPIELVSTAGNVLSYARLMAVGLAGVVLAMVANEMASRSLWGIVAAVVLHLINLVLCIFSPTIHAMRLHLVEFFTKFYETGGAAYKPLTRREGA
jgi:V/A-type H+-transporting ATPase subunit I